jgi:hypothetical protein
MAAASTRKELLVMLEEHRSGLHNHTRQLRTLLMAKLWLQEFFPLRANAQIKDGARHARL